MCPFSPFVFTTADGTPFPVVRIDRTFRRAKLLAGITRRFRFKGLRHTFGCVLADREVSLQNDRGEPAERYARVSAQLVRNELAAALDDVPAGTIAAFATTSPPTRFNCETTGWLMPATSNPEGCQNLRRLPQQRRPSISRAAPPAAAFFSGDTVHEIHGLPRSSHPFT